MTKGSEEEAGAAGPEIQNPDVTGGNGAQGTGADKPPQTGDATEADSPGAKGAKGKPSKKVRYKKIRPRKKAGRQTHAIIVAVPAESEEIKDTGAAAKRGRGRPRKSKKANSPDPGKGSVLNPGEGVCADPGKGDATLGVGGPGPQRGDSEHQLSPDRGGGKT
jgi:hypothetical protein